ncbi:HAD hydrolase-like protein [Lachnoclostridium sp. Marseille-P6806]|uniref:HAD hydrolase-like protein n=1 Tax=Lachnoclostridium sp. Marseille-P6806 TaxID=2364793 RepID=UPI0010301B75|nr:HAD hydrolase-like protein [Lachnoclostridium sp. Marseille-P6806]
MTARQYRADAEGGEEQNMNRFDCCLFDLDGTLTESAPGIVRSVEYALWKLGAAIPGEAELRDFVGPPLSASFARYCCLSPEEIGRAVEFFRERYAVTGIYENALYPGVKELLMACWERGVRLAVASSKPEEHVRTVLSYFDIAAYFDVICGSPIERERDGKVRFSDKEEIVRLALRSLEEKTGRPEVLSRAAMIGDRSFDMLGAAANGLFPVGVLYGYGSREELEEAGAEYIAEDAEALRRLILGEGPDAAGTEARI